MGVMENSPEDLGLIEALIIDLEKTKLPRAMDIKEKVDRGERLDEFDTAFLQDAFAAETKVDAISERHAEYQALAARMSHLYKEITEKALANEERPELTKKTQ
jgi:hypothetical protein